MKTAPAHHGHGGSYWPAPASDDETAAPLEGDVVEPEAATEACHTLVPTLRRLIDEAAETGERLDEAVQQAEGRTHAADDASRRFQDRLRVGVKLLQAFEAQVTRMEILLTDADAMRAVEERQAELERRLAELETRLATARSSPVLVEPKLVPVVRSAYQRRRLRS